MTTTITAKSSTATRRAAARQKNERMSARPKTALVLAGGGSYGAVQVGMLRALCAHGVQPDLLDTYHDLALGGQAQCLSQVAPNIGAGYVLRVDHASDPIGSHRNANG